MIQMVRFAKVLVFTFGSAVVISDAAAKDSVKGKLIDCGADKAVLFDQPKSPDGRYAIGWTLRPNSAKAKPVDWSKWDSEAPYDLLDQYNYLDPEITGVGAAPLVDATKSPATLPASKTRGAPYELSDCVVDLKEKKLLLLRSVWPYWPNKNHGELIVTWGGNHVVIFNEARFDTQDIWLVTVQDGEMRQMELSRPLNKEVNRYLKIKRPLTWGAYGISWTPEMANDVPIFHKSTVRLPFSANIPKEAYEPVDGSVTVDPATGKILKSDCSSKRDDPFLDSPELAKADAELNSIYKKLQEQLNATGRAALLQEQRAWLAGRDYASPPDAGSNLSASVIVFRSDHISPVPSIGMDFGDYDSFNKTRDASLIKSTKERTAELKKRLSK